MDLFDLYDALPMPDRFSESISEATDYVWLPLLYEKLNRLIIDKVYSSYGAIVKNNLLDLPYFTYSWRFTSSDSDNEFRLLETRDFGYMRNCPECYDEIFSQKVIPAIFSIDKWDYFTFETRGSSYLDFYGSDNADSDSSENIYIEELNDEQFLSVYFELEDLFKDEKDISGVLAVIRNIAEADSYDDSGRSVVVIKNYRIPPVMEFIDNHSDDELKKLLGKDYIFAQRLLHLIKTLGFEVTESNVYSHIYTKEAQYWVLAPYNESETGDIRVSFYNSANVRFYLIPLLINQCLDVLEPYVLKSL